MTSNVGCNDAGEVLNNPLLIKQLIRLYLRMTNAVTKEVFSRLNKTTLSVYLTHQCSQTCNDLWD